MKTKFLCLANSQKFGENYIAGIELNQTEKGYEFILDQNKKPVWVRPKLSKAEADKWMPEITLFDVIEIDITERCPDGCHSENVKIKPGSLKKLKKHPLSNQVLKKLINHTSRSLFGNKGTSLNRRHIEKLKSSLALIKAQKPQYYSPVPFNNRNLRMKFYYNNHLYDLPVTDKAITDNHFYFRPLFTDPDHTYLTISLNTLPNERHYKVIAGVVDSAMTA